MADQLRLQRKPIPASLTRTVNELKELIGAEELNNFSIQLKYNKVLRIFERLQEFDRLLLDAILAANCTEAEYEAEHTSIEKYDDEWSEVKLRVKMMKPKSRPNSPTPSDFSTARSGVSGFGGKKRSFKLPKIEMKKLNGEVTEWLGFWSQFQKIHEDEELHATDRFQYLVQSMVTGTRAKEVVDAYPPTAANYPKVIKSLEDRFGKPKMLKRVHIRELLNLVITNDVSKVKISDIYDRLESHLHALECLGISADQMDVLLFPLVESCLPLDILTAWQRSSNYGRDGSGDDPPQTEFHYLMLFIKQEVESEHQRGLAQSTFGIPVTQMKQLTVSKKAKAERSDWKSDIATAAGLFAGQESGCVFCDKSHPSQECGKAQTLSLSEKDEKIREKKACFSCLRRGHSSKKCKSFVECVMCSKKHHALMCPDLLVNKKPKSTSVKESCGGGQTVATNLSCSSSVLLKTLIVRAIGKRNQRMVRVIFDDGSQRSYVKQSTARQLQINPIGTEVMKKSLFGGHITESRHHQRYQLALESLDRSHRQELTLIDEPTLWGTIPNVPNGPWMQELAQHNIHLTDTQSESADIDILIGSDYWGKMMTGNVVKLQSSLLAMDSVAMMVTSALFIENCSVADLWSLDTIGIRDPIESLSKQEKKRMVTQHFAETVKRKSNGRYSVCLPWANRKDEIPSNRSVAEKRLLHATNKLHTLGMFNSYEEIFRSWEKEGIVEEVKDESENGHFLPHRAVFKPESLTTPVRPVFDASCKLGRNPSLNKCLEKGPNLMELIPSILLRFREKKIGVISDIRKAFQMIDLEVEDRRFLRFLWWKDFATKKLKVFQHKRVVFGVNCSPFLLLAVLEHHLHRHVNEEDTFFAKKLLRSLYVDNCVTSVDSEEQYQSFKNVATRLLADAKMDLWQWEKTEDTFRIGQPNGGGCGLGVSGALSDVSSVLGLSWDKREDNLRVDFKLEDLPEHENITKRKMLSVVQIVFDPLGFCCPATLQLKLMLQDLWMRKLGWDDAVATEIREKFLTWCHGLHHFHDIRIPRQVFSTKGEIQLHTYGDASQSAYAAVVFVRTLYEGKVTVRLAHAKARVSPLKKGTIPRLELLACLIGARLTSSVREALNLEGVPLFYWSDSTTALSWIRQNDDWGTFVGNRVKEILRHTEFQEWKFVPGIANPADLPSRGCSPAQLLDSKWWEGPKWLYNSPHQWPLAEEVNDDEEIGKERKKSLQVMVSTEVAPPVCYHPPFSSYQKNVRVFAWVRRFIRNSRRVKAHKDYMDVISLKESRIAEVDLLHPIQSQCFSTEVNKIGGVSVTMKDDGLLHVKTKLLNKNDTELFVWPIVLPNRHVDQLISEVHRTYGHIGIQALIGKLREKFWILQGRRAVRRVIRQCVRCRRYEAKAMEVEQAALPQKRVTTSHAFQTTGVDLAGPLFLKDGKKTWIVLYTCAVYRCVALDLVSSLSTEAFLGSLERFIHSYGRPETIFSDNGTNFLGTHNLFKKLDWEKIKKASDVQNIQWIFNPPTAAWWGGWWERLIRSVKDLLKRMLGRARLDEERLRTCLSAVAAAINNRPLTTITEDSDDLVPLTPAMFLRGPTGVRFPEVVEMNSKDFQEDFRRTASLRRELEGRFRREYLSLLIQKIKEKNTTLPIPGDIVLVGADNKKRLEWPMGRIMDLIPGKDGQVRVARVKTEKGILIRPLQRLYPLEVPNPLKIPTTAMTKDQNSIHNKEQEVVLEEEPVAEIKTRLGLIVRKPSRLFQ